MMEPQKPPAMFGLGSYGTEEWRGVLARLSSIEDEAKKRERRERIGKAIKRLRHDLKVKYGLSERAANALIFNGEGQIDDAQGIIAWAKERLEREKQPHAFLCRWHGVGRKTANEIMEVVDGTDKAGVWMPKEGTIKWHVYQWKVGNMTAEEAMQALDAGFRW